MSEITESFENIPNNAPSEREVFNKFEELANGRGIEEVEKRRKEDEEGLVRCEVVTTDETGARLELEFNRGKTAVGGEVLLSRITQTTFTADGMPCGSGDQYDYFDGEWTLAPDNMITLTRNP